MPTLLDLLDSYRLYDLQQEVKEKDACNFGKHVREQEEELFTELNEEQIKKVKELEIMVRNQEEYIAYELQIYILNIAFRMGMEMQRSFDEDDYE